MFSQRVLITLKRIVTTLSADSRTYLFGKVGIDIPPDNWGFNRAPQQIDELDAANDRRLAELSEDLAQNHQYYRAGVAPKYLIDVPYDDWRRFLSLDGWAFVEGRLNKREAEIFNVQVEEDELVQRLRASGLPNIALIETHLNRAATDYGRDNNNSMTNSRQALEQLLQDIATATVQGRNEPQPGGPVRDYLQRCGFLTEEEKRGFSGTYGFLSGGPHPGIVDQEAARLGRNFALGSCQYALQKYERWVANGYRGF